MKILLIKIGGSALALGSLGIVTYFVAKELSKSKTIKEKLTSEGFKFIPSSNNKQWEEEFNSDQEKIKSLLENLNANWSILKAWCESKFNSSSSNEKDLVDVKKYCLIRDIKNQLERKGRKLLVGIFGEDVDRKWTETIQKRKLVNKDGEKLDLRGEWDVSASTEKIKKWCEDKSKSDFLVEEEIYKLVEAWCTEEGKTITLN